MLQDMAQPSSEQLPFEEISSPLNAQIFDFCESELFQETLQNSEVASNSNCCYEEQSSYPNNTNNSSLLPDMNQFTNTILVNDENLETPSTTVTSSAPATITSTTTADQNNNLSMVFDSPEDIENDISVSIDFTTNPPTNFTIPNQHYFTSNNNQLTPQDQFDYSSLNNNQTQITDLPNCSILTQYQNDQSMVNPLMGPPHLPPFYEEECLSAMPPYMRLTSSNPSFNLLDPTLRQFLPGNLSAALTADNAGIFNGGCLFLGTELPPQELDFQGESGGMFCSDAMNRVYNCPNELQAISNESQHMVSGGANSTPLAPEISSLEDPTFKVGKLTVEERKEKIHRYMKKRNERNFSKKIKYACRKTLADSRPRVRGRFAKNDELEMARTTCSISNHEEDTDEDFPLQAGKECRYQKVVVKEEDDMVDSSDIFAHISGVNSFKCNNPLQSWI